MKKLALAILFVAAFLLAPGHLELSLPSMTDAAFD
jgi:hypothetical protein